MVALRAVLKYFPANKVTALSGADFDLRAGEIHALVGENGAGKSTLMHIMAGFLRPDAGTVAVDGAVKTFASPARALAAGIGMVRQHPRLVPEFTVWENCVLGSEGGPLLGKRRLRGEAAALNEAWGFGLPLDARARELPVSAGQMAAVLALLRRGARYLVFDEPTAVLGPPETERLFALFKKLKSEGRGIVLISHKLNEVTRLADRITVLAGGKTAAVLDARGTNEEELAALMFAGSGGGTRREAGRVFQAGPPGKSPPALELTEVAVNVPGRPLIRGVSFAVSRGEAAGVVGVRDSGLETLELAVAGFFPSSGTIAVNGTRLDGGFEARNFGKNTRGFRAAGGAYLGTREDGAAEAALSLRDILVIHAHRRFTKRGFLDARALAAWSRAIIARAKTGEVSDAASSTSFSGGQFQRFLLAREFAEESPLLVLAEPGRGLDRKSREELAALIRERAAGGSGVLVFSTDSEALLSICDTVMVLRDGRIVDAVDVRSCGFERAGKRVREAMVREAVNG